MRRMWLAGVVVPAAALGYACSTDTFESGDASADGGEAAAPVSQADFCDAEAKVATHCGFDAACETKNLTNCGVLYAAFNPGVAAVYVSCANMSQIMCGNDLYAPSMQPCVATGLTTFVNDGGAMAALTSDYCHACFANAVASCSVAFVTQPNAGYSASLLSDAIISEIDHDCVPKNDASVTSDEAGTVCATTFAFCEDVIIGQDFPGDACKDGG